MAAFLTLHCYFFVISECFNPLENGKLERRTIKKAGNSYFEYFSFPVAKVQILVTNRRQVEIETGSFNAYHAYHAGIE